MGDADDEGQSVIEGINGNASVALVQRRGVLKFRGHKPWGRDRGTGPARAWLSVYIRQALPLSLTAVLQLSINSVGLPRPRSSDLVQQGGETLKKTGLVVVLVDALLVGVG